MELPEISQSKINFYLTLQGLNQKTEHIAVRVFQNISSVTIFPSFDVTLIYSFIFSLSRSLCSIFMKANAQVMQLDILHTT